METKMIPFNRNTLVPLVLAASFSTQAADQLEEVIVSADFRDTQLMTTAGSITVLGPQLFEERGALHLEDVLSAAPNVSWSTGASRSRFIQMRGVGDLEQYAEPKYYPSVGLMMDELELGSAANSGMLFDVAQVEVLRGPQGTRFGASAHAGMLKMRSNAPTEEFEAEFSGGAGNYDSYNLGAVVSGSLGQSVRARAAIQHNESDGYIDNKHLDRSDTNNFEELTGRILLQWDASDRSQYDLGVYAFNSDNGYDAYSLDNDNTTWSDQPGVDEQDSLAFTVKGQWLLSDQMTLEAVATRMDSELLYSYDADWVSPEACEINSCSGGYDTAMEIFDRDRDQTTLDIRLLGGSDSQSAGALSYVVGIYGNSSSERLDYAYPSVWYGNYESGSRYDTDRYALYGELGYTATDKLTLTAGLRVERFEDDYRDSNGVGHDNSDDLWNGELTAEYAFSDNTYGYATLALANKPGGVNVSASSQYNFMSPDFQDFMSDQLRFEKETLFNREIGVKTRQFDQRLSLRAALFYASRDNAQLENWMWDDAAGLWIGYLDSTGDVKSYGVELESSFDVSSAVQLFANIGLLRAEVDEISTFDQDQWDFVIKKDREQSKSPEYQFNAGIRASFTDRLSGTLEVEGRDDSFFGYYHDGELEGYELLNGSLSWAGEKLTLTLWGRNLTDEEYATHGLYFAADPRDDFGAWTNQSYYQFGAPRTYGLNLGYAL
jgi:iron complex outermembrane receptor protein